LILFGSRNQPRHRGSLDDSLRLSTCDVVTQAVPHCTVYYWQIVCDKGARSVMRRPFSANHCVCT